MKVKKPNILRAFLSNSFTSENESFSIYADILENSQGVLKNNFVFGEGGHARIKKKFGGVG